MTKSQFVREQMRPLMDLLKPYINPEDDPKAFEQKIELWILRLLADVDSICTDPTSAPEDL